MYECFLETTGGKLKDIYEGKKDMGGGATRTVVTDSLNQLMAQSFLNVTTSCQAKQDLTQDITIDCNGTINNGTEFFEENPTCLKCYTNVLEQQNARYNLIRAGWKGSRAPIPVSYSQDLTNMWLSLQQCKYTCKACVFADFSQQSTYHFKQTCSVSTSMANEFKNNLSQNLTQALTDNQDVLSSIATVLGASDKQSTVSNILNRLESNFSATFLQSLVSRIHDTQQITIRAKNGGQTILADTQTNSLNSVSEIFASTNIANDVLNNQQWAIYQKLYNDENTIGDLGNTLANTVLGIGNIAETLVGKIMIGVCVLLVLVVIIVTVIVIVNAVKHRKGGGRASVITGR